MRTLLGAYVVFSIGAGLSLLGCGTQSEVAEGDAGPDGYQYLPPVVHPCDGGTPLAALSRPNDDKVACYDSLRGAPSTCDTFLKGDVVCCGDIPNDCGQGPWRCMPTAACTGTRSFQCDENDDCPKLLICCGITNLRGLITGSFCAKDCSGPQICTKTQECPTGSTCKPSAATDTPFTLGACESPRP
ncbi:MAG: hypothetical protein NVS3B20_23830 [Polyangiales bacterium]